MVKMKIRALSGFVATALFDTLVFFSITSKILKDTIGTYGSGNSWIAASVRADNLHHFSKTLLRSGQIYYLCVFCQIHNTETINITFSNWSHLEPP